MKLEIKSRKLGKTLEFRAPDNGGYIRLWSEPRREWIQIAEGGQFVGSMLDCPANEGAFVRRCRQWYRNYIQTEK